jgi:tRNA(fMet)-specific endonuclease VapC
MREVLEEEELWISVHVACELFAGAELSRGPEDERQRILDFCGGLQIAYPTATFAQTYGRLLASLQRSGRTVGAMDLLIATAAVVDDASLLTRNVEEFSRIPGLKVVGY